jgi:hypothetical protein
VTVSKTVPARNGQNENLYNQWHHSGEDDYSGGLGGSTQAGFFNKRVENTAVQQGGHKVGTIKNIPETTETHCRAVITTSYYAMDVFWSGREDSNLRPPAPKAGALTRLRYAPIPKKRKKPD